MIELLKAVHISDEIRPLDALKRIEPSIAEPLDSTPRDEDAYHRGFEDGYRDGKHRSQSEFIDQMNTLASLIQHIPEAIQDNRQHLSKDIADIVLHITQTLFINQVLHKDSLTIQINQILSQIHQQQKIEIALHPTDIARLQQHNIPLAFKPHQNIKFIADDSLTLGGCIIHTEHGMFNGSVERQIENLKQQLIKMRNEY